MDDEADIYEAGVRDGYTEADETAQKQIAELEQQLAAASKRIGELEEGLRYYASLGGTVARALLSPSGSQEERKA